MSDVAENAGEERNIDDVIDQIIADIDAKELLAAMEGCRQALTLEKDYPPAIYLMGLVAHENDDLGLAIDLVTRAHELDPQCQDFASMLAVLEAKAGRLSDALYHAKLATALVPHRRHPNLAPQGLPTGAKVFDEVGLSRHRINGEVALGRGLFEEAAREGEAELHINRENIEAMVLTARAQMALGRLDPALAHLRAAIHLDPRSLPVRRWAGEVLQAAGHQDEALAMHRSALALAPEDAKLAAQILQGLSWQTDGNHLAAAPLADSLRACIEGSRTRRRAARLGVGQIGMIWDQCHNGPLLGFLLPVLREMENVIFYLVNRRADAGTELVRTSVLRFVDCVNLDAPTIDRVIAGDAADAVINLCGGSQETHFPLLQGDEAPARLQWLGLPLPERLPAVDGVIGSPETSDLDERIFGAGNVVTLPRLLAWRFPTTGVEEENVGPSPRDRNGHVTFGALGEARRIGADTAALWAEALLAVPGSQLILASSVSWPQSSMQRLFELFSNFGVTGRVDLQMTDSPGVNLDFFSRIDVMLDSAPVTCMNEIAEALWMGVPVISLKGIRRAGRSGAAILAAAGHPDWIAGDSKEFAALALRLGGEPGLAELRAGLRDQIEASPLCDTAGFAKEFRSAVLGFRR